MLKSIIYDLIEKEKKDTYYEITQKIKDSNIKDSNIKDSNIKESVNYLVKINDFRKDLVKSYINSKRVNSEFVSRTRLYEI